MVTKFYLHRGVRTSDIKTIVGYFDRAFKLAIEVQNISGPKLVDWRKELETNETIQKSIAALRTEVEEFAVKFPLPGREDI
jgi:glycine hydroxymethyltransferase